MVTSANHSTSSSKMQRVALAAAVMVAATATVAAKDYRPVGAHHYALYEHRSVSVGAAAWHRADLPYLGTVGRGDLPERPVHPEGVANFAD